MTSSTVFSCGSHVATMTWPTEIGPTPRATSVSISTFGGGSHNTRTCPVDGV